MLAISNISESSEVTIILSKHLDSFKQLIALINNESPQKLFIFFLKTPFEHPLAGNIAQTTYSIII